MSEVLRQRAMNDKAFMEAYKKCKLPLKQHEKLSPRRQYSKYLKRRGIVWQSKSS